MSHYYDKEVNLKSERKSFNFSFNNKKFEFMTDNGVFSKGYIDFGTQQMLSNFRESNLEGPILDMCCGYGIVGIILKKFTSSDIYMTDVNERAVELSKDNAKINKVDVSIYSGNLFDSLPDIKFKNILVNPPIRAGKEIVFKIYEGSYDRLLTGGELYVVIQKKQGAPSTIKKLEELFSKVTIIAREKGYYIINAVK